MFYISNTQTHWVNRSTASADQKKIDVGQKTKVPLAQASFPRKNPSLNINVQVLREISPSYMCTTLQNVDRFEFPNPNLQAAFYDQKGRRDGEKTLSITIAVIFGKLRHGKIAQGSFRG